MNEVRCQLAELVGRGGGSYVCVEGAVRYLGKEERECVCVCVCVWRNGERPLKKKASTYYMSIGRWGAVSLYVSYLQYQ